MALKAGRVGVSPTEVDAYGKVIGGGGGGGGTTVVANPSGEATSTLEKLQVGSTIYGLPSGGGGGIYYNDWSIENDTQAGGYYWSQAYGVQVDGYTPTSAVPIKTGSSYSVFRGICLLQAGGSANEYVVKIGKTDGFLSSSSAKVRVYYAKNSDMEAIG